MSLGHRQRVGDLLDPLLVGIEERQSGLRQVRSGQARTGDLGCMSFDGEPRFHQPDLLARRLCRVQERCRRQGDMPARDPVSRGAWARRRQPAEGEVHFHCSAGVNRGSSAAYAVLRALGHTPTEAFALIRDARPKAGILYADSADAAVKALGFAGG